uniref:Uncharacterized protein n=1 Tax=Oryza glumipatula TaxID=40148 RepID=A0A0E0BMA8_9ORYZ
MHQPVIVQVPAGEQDLLIQVQVQLQAQDQLKQVRLRFCSCCDLGCGCDYGSGSNSCCGSYYIQNGYHHHQVHPNGSSHQLDFLELQLHLLQPSLATLEGHAD